MGPAASTEPGVGLPAVVSNPFFRPSSNSISADYEGGWGFKRNGLDAGGIVTLDPGLINAAGILAPLTWTADTQPNIPPNCLQK